MGMLCVGVVHGAVPFVSHDVPAGELEQSTIV